MPGAYRILLFDIDGNWCRPAGRRRGMGIRAYHVRVAAHVVLRHSVSDLDSSRHSLWSLLGLSLLLVISPLALAGLVTGVAGIALTAFLEDLAARAVGELF